MRRAARETFRTQYVVGADGARSFVRHTLGIEFEGYTEPQTLPAGRHQDQRWRTRSPQLPYLVARRRHGCPAPVRTGHLAHVRRPAGQRRSWSARGPKPGRPAPPPWKGCSSTWTATVHPTRASTVRAGLSASFRTNERLAPATASSAYSLQATRPISIVPPAARGMNTGIQDATNLGWKLAYVLSGRGEADLLLDSYEAERRPTARDVIAGAAGKSMWPSARTGSRGSASRYRRDGHRQPGGGGEEAATGLVRETDITYRDGPLVALGAQPGRTRRTDVGTRARDIEFGDSQNGLTATLWPILCSGRPSC